ncbi:DUF4280 domain-containing protein [Chryseobacterium sp. MYb264]|uniref:DUF4280 domain-containing protein n=1 Tax=Chryseobacterium sp. MYb264 TaxID=2745153 RepID=UPI002E0DBCA5|nr:DUF4280 domain-containing protein [Chryseobacterium sp. MYb264]
MKTYKVQKGMILTVPEEHEAKEISENYARRMEELEKKKKLEQENSIDTESSEPEPEKEPENDQQEKEKQEKKETKEKEAGEHDGKLFVIQKGKAICDKGTQFPQFKVSSHQKHYLNNEGHAPDYLAVTENDLQFNPPAAPFGNCSLKNNQPCTFAPAGKWQKVYTDVKVLGNALLTEISELQCSIGGKIKIKDHGQREELSKQNFKNADAKVHQYINPMVDLRRFNEQLDGDNFYS